MSSPKPSLADKIAELAASWAEHAPPASAEARTILDTLQRDYADFQKFLARRFTRLAEAQQQALIALLQAAQTDEFSALLQQWSHDSAVSLRTRARILTAQEHAGLAVEAPYQQALLQAEKTLRQLCAADPPPLTPDGAFPPDWNETILRLPLSLALDLARDLALERPHLALAVLGALRPIVDARDCHILVEHMAAIPLSESALALQDMLFETTDKALQKVIKRALHRLKTQGVAIDESRQHQRSVVGTVQHRLERCLASHIDGAGDRVLWMIRTKPFGGYHIAYLVINYGTGIQYALGLQASKRELPELLAKAQEHARLITLEPSYCQYQVALAHQMNLDTSTPVPEEFFALRDIIGVSDTTFEKAIIYSVLSDADLQEAHAYADHADDLLALPEFAGWTLPATIIQKYGDQLHNLEESQIVVSPALRQEQMREIYARATEEALGEQSRRIMRLRLEEMAYYLLETERRREALWAVAAAQTLEEADPDRLQRNPFAGALLERSLEQAKERPGSRIIQPFAHLPGGGSSSLSI